MTKLARLLSVIVLLTAAHPAAAEPVDEASKKAARDLGRDGIKAYRRGDYAVATDELERAFAIMKVPTMGLWSARALEKTGRLVQASERYQQVMRMPAGDEPTFEKAKEDAAAEHAALQPRIAGLVIVCENAEPTELTVTVDGTPVPVALLGVRRPANPGNAKVEARWREQVLAREVQLAEGQEERVVLHFEPEPPRVIREPIPKPEPAPPVENEVPPSSPTIVRIPEEGTTQRALGWLAMGIGGAGIGLGSISLWITLSYKSDLDKNCENGTCPPSEAEDVGSYKVLHWFPVAGFVAGGVGIAAGIALLVTAPSADAAPEQAGVSVWLAGDRVGVQGKF
jgi:hypothetical protein